MNIRELIEVLKLNFNLEDEVTIGDCRLLIIYKGETNINIFDPAKYLEDPIGYWSNE